MIKSHFAVHCFVTAVLLPIFHFSYSSAPVMRLDYQILLKSPPLNLLAGSAHVFSTTKRCGSNTVELDDGWRLFYSGVEPAECALAGVEILVSSTLASCVVEWIPLGRRVLMLRLNLLGPLPVFDTGMRIKLKRIVPGIRERNYCCSTKG